MRVRALLLVGWHALLVLIAAAFSPLAAAASHYTQNFSGSAPGWSIQTTNDTFLVDVDHYRNDNGTAQAPERSIATFNNDTWLTDYSYRLRMNSDWEGAGNQVGAVFNFSNTSNYYEVLFSMAGVAVLNKVIAGARTEVARYDSPGGDNWPVRDTWFDVEILKQGNATTIRLNGATIITTTGLTQLAAGRIGVLTQFNIGRFDDVQVTLQTSYTQDFTSGAPGWQLQTTNDTFGVTGGDYRNTNGTPQAPERSISVYTGTQWNTGYTYRLRMFSDWDGTGNQIGAVFNFVNLSNYYEVLFNMSGTATLNRVVGGARQLVQTYTAPSGAPWPVRDTWFDVEIARSGTNTTIRLGTTTVFSVSTLTEHGAGYIGVLTQFNLGRFDNVTVTGGVSVPPPVYLFRTGFGSSVSMTPAECIGPTGAGAWFQSISGGDVSGFTWPPSANQFWGVPRHGLFQSTVPCPQYALGSYVQQDIESIADGPGNTTSRVLWNKVLNHRGPWTEGTGARSGLTYAFVPGTTSAQGYYIRRHLRYPANIMSRMGQHGWFAQHEYKTRCDNEGKHGRMVIYWHRDEKPEPYYRLMVDNNNNCSDSSTMQYEERCTPQLQPDDCPPFPQGVWFHDEVHVLLPTQNSPGRIKYAVNGKKIFDTETVDGQTLPWPTERVKLSPGYLNMNGEKIQVDNLEVLVAPPCAEFPCGAPPIVP